MQAIRLELLPPVAGLVYLSSAVVEVGSERFRYGKGKTSG